MKTYVVDFSPRAHGEAIEVAGFIAKRAPSQAVKWLDGLQQVLDSLTAMPTRCGLARESFGNDQALRQYIYHSHRIVFYVDEGKAVVRILHVRHTSMQPLDLSADDGDES